LKRLPGAMGSKASSIREKGKEKGSVLTIDTAFPNLADAAPTPNSIQRSDLSFDEPRGSARGNLS